MISRGEIGLYNSINLIIWLWVALLIFIQLKVLNDYSFKKSVGVLLLSVFAFVTFWGTVGLVFALTNHVLQFVREVPLKFDTYWRIKGIRRLRQKSEKMDVLYNASA